jgi:hypothetical protein
MTAHVLRSIARQDADQLGASPFAVIQKQGYGFDASFCEGGSRGL